MLKTTETLKKVLGICFDKQSEAYNKLSDILQSQNIDIQPLTDLVESTEALCAVRASIVDMREMQF